MSRFDPEELDGLSRLLRAISPAPPNAFVVAGGWAARLLRSHHLAAEPRFDVVRTRDIDVVANHNVKAPLSVGAELQRQGFKLELASDERPPLTRYVLGAFELEFIVPEFPSRHRLGATLEVMGTSAQFVKDGAMLLYEPVQLSIAEIGTSVAVVNPASFLLQKLLIIANRRSLEKRGKDTVYLHDALLTFSHDGRVRPEIIEQAARVLATLSPGQRKRLQAQRSKLGSPGDRCCIEAAAQMRQAGRSATPEQVALAIRLGLDDVMGDSRSS